MNDLHPREEDPMTLTLFPASRPRTAPTPESADHEETLVCFSAGWVAELGSLPLTGGAGSTVGSGVHKRATFETQCTLGARVVGCPCQTQRPEQNFCGMVEWPPQRKGSWERTAHVNSMVTRGQGSYQQDHYLGSALGSALESPPPPGLPAPSQLLTSRPMSSSCYNTC